MENTSFFLNYDLFPYETHISEDRDKRFNFFDNYYGFEYFITLYVSLGDHTFAPRIESQLSESSEVYKNKISQRK